MLSLDRRWQQTWGWVGRSAPPTFWADLRRRYGEPHRVYHTLEHLEACFQALDQVPLHQRPPWTPRDRFCLEMALWCHDGVYDVTRSDNEDQSSQWAGQALAATGVAEATIAPIQHLITTTAHGSSPPDLTLGDGLTPWLLDLDLAILGAPWIQFQGYECQIRQEYAIIPDSEFQVGRQRVLQQFWQRNFIYHTAYGRQQWEDRARQNLESSMAALTTALDA